MSNAGNVKPFNNGQTHMRYMFDKSKVDFRYQEIRLYLNITLIKKTVVFQFSPTDPRPLSFQDYDLWFSITLNMFYIVNSIVPEEVVPIRNYTSKNLNLCMSTVKVNVCLLLR